MFQKILICNKALYSTSILKTHISSFLDCVFFETSTTKELLAKIKHDAKNDNYWDCLFLDLELKEGSPIPVIPEIRRISPKTKIVITGGVSLTDENIAIALKLGVQHFLPKPFDNDYIYHIFNLTDEAKGEI